MTETNKPVGHDHTCHCGTGCSTPHETGTNGCVRSIVETPVKTESGTWRVDGREISEFTLIQQRGYFRHACGCWSNHSGSSTSLDVI